MTTIRKSQLSQNRAPALRRSLGTQIARPERHLGCLILPQKVNVHHTKQGGVVRQSSYKSYSAYRAT
jgi:hypothetical protein